MAKVAAVGAACLDHRFWVEEFPPTGGRTPATAYRADLGGSAAVGAVAVVRLGGDAIFFGCRGGDDVGEQVASRLRAERVDTSGLRVYEHLATPVSGIVIAPGGERYIFPHGSGGMPADAGWLPLDAVAAVDAVLADPHWPAGAMRVAQAARRRALPVVLDLDKDTPATWGLAAVSTHVIADQPLSAACGGVDALLQRLSAMGVWGAVTLGDGGVAYGAGAGRLPAFRVSVTDTTGAGDVFHGAFALALAEGQDEAYALTFASAAAAQRCALGDVPTRRDVIRLLETGR